MTEETRNKIGRRAFVKGAAAGAVLLSAAQSSSVAAPETTLSTGSSLSASHRPNVIFILADDLGWGDLSCYGRPDYHTPHLDRLAQQGTRFTDAYSASPVCTPTRCGFITGRYPARLRIGLEEPLQGGNDRVGLDPGHPTIASLLKQNGYETALFGKWHLGFRPEWGPNSHGFDEFFGILGGAGDYFLHRNGMGKPDLYENLTPVERHGYLTELLTERAVEYVSGRRRNPIAGEGSDNRTSRTRTGALPHGRASASPFYLSLHYTAPHWPWQGPKGGESATFSENLPEPISLGGGGSLKLYAEMMRSLDDGVGKVMTTLAKAGLDRNTLVIFTSDNGGERFSYEWPFSGQKLELLEGGVRVPAIVRWPGVVSANVVTNQAAITMDWTATILAATETKPDTNYPLDGEDLLPVIKRTNPVHDRTLFWRTSRQDAVRSGKWKYFRTGTERFLFDLSVDEREKADLAKRYPDVLKGLSAQFESWGKQMLPRPQA